MAIASDVEVPVQPAMTNPVGAEPAKTFRVPTTPVDGQGDVVAFIGPGVEFKGEIYYQGSVQIDGTLDGHIHTDGTLLVGEQAVINAKVNAGTVISKGKVNGDIVATRQAQFLSSAVMDGSLKAPKLSMEIGVVFNGDISMSQGSSGGNQYTSSQSKNPSVSGKPASAVAENDKKSKDHNAGRATAESTNAESQDQKNNPDTQANKSEHQKSKS